ncbi:ABC transporter ATP-binding protein [Actinomycetospora chiangmaiensis]|uniref:ABC transporter ATP-binding protein n=1 Tax=Actinomycetospora chiangmaiensis TaxID=402650 RepID=UPI0003604DE1|nr:ABC transporter ATP-binding protein [Actinomycetospora chiangmaiensis]
MGAHSPTTTADSGVTGDGVADDGPDLAAPPLTLRAIVRRFGRHTHGDRTKLVLAFFFMAASTACDTYVVTMFARIVDGATVARSMAAVWPSAIEWMALTALGGVLSVTGGWLMVGAAERFVFRLRHDVFEHLQRLGPSFFSRHATGDLISRLSTDIDGVEALASSGIVTTLIAVGTAIAYAAAAVLVQWQLALIVVALAPLMWLTSRITGRFTRTAARVERAAAGEVGTSIQQSLQNLPIVQSYGTESVESARLDHHAEVWWRARARESRLQMIYAPISTIIQSGALLAVLIAGAAFIAAGELTVGGLFGFAAYLGYLYPPLSQLGSLNLTITAASASCERLLEILDAEPDVIDVPDALGSPVRTGRVELRDVRYVYPGTESAGLGGVSLDVRPGQFVLVTGPSGAGKSTLTRLLLRFVDVQSGAILLDGVDVRDRTLAAVRGAVTLLPQKPMLFDLTVRENIAYSRPDATDAEIEAAARDAGALDFVRELPNGFDTLVGEDGAVLSGGQRQRLAIARALLRTSPVLVLDEPTTGLDAPTARAVLDPLRRLSGGRTTIVVSHDLTPARDADLVVVLDAGSIVQQGRHADLLARPGVYADLWAAQQGDRRDVEPVPVAPARPARPVPPRRPQPVPALVDAVVTNPLRLLALAAADAAISATTRPTPLHVRGGTASRRAPADRGSRTVAPAASGPRPGRTTPAPAPSRGRAPSPVATPSPGPTPSPTPALGTAPAPGPAAAPGRPGRSSRSIGTDDPFVPNGPVPRPTPPPVPTPPHAPAVPGPRDPASGPTPASRAHPTSGPSRHDGASPRRRTVADLVSGAPEGRSAHRRPDAEPVHPR